MIDLDDFVNSQMAIQSYMAVYSGVHQARVIVIQDGEEQYNSFLDVFAQIENEQSTINISGDIEFDSNYYSRYSNKFQLFFYEHDMLIIEGVDKMRNPVTLEIVEK